MAPQRDSVSGCILAYGAEPWLAGSTTTSATATIGGGGGSGNSSVTQPTVAIVTSAITTTPAPSSTSSTPTVLSFTTPTPSPSPCAATTMPSTASTMVRLPPSHFRRTRGVQEADDVHKSKEVVPAVVAGLGGEGTVAIRIAPSGKPAQCIVRLIPGVVVPSGISQRVVEGQGEGAFGHVRTRIHCVRPCSHLLGKLWISVLPVAPLHELPDVLVEVKAIANPVGGTVLDLDINLLENTQVGGCKTNTRGMASLPGRVRVVADCPC